MSVEFQPDLVELTQRGTTAALLLNAQKRLCAICVEQVLKKIDEAIVNDRMTPDRALLWVAELAAFRQIVRRQEQDIQHNVALRARVMQEAAGHV